MHLEAAHGMTVHEIEQAGFTVAERVDMHVDGDTPQARTLAMAKCMAGMAEALQRLNPACVVILGDRYEMLAAAAAAAMAGIPIAHIAGGTISEGAIDNSIRHAITKLSTLHLVETDEHRHRVIQMGEQPQSVITAGALGVWNIMHQKLMGKAELEATLDGFALDRAKTLLVTYHPATLGGEDPVEAFGQLTAALDRFADSTILITYPNNDAGGEALIAAVEKYASSQPGRVKAVRSLGMIRYLSALQNVAAVVGNSSSGIVEVPSAHIPTVDIGIRQRGRQCAESVIHCADDADSIAEAIALALSPEGQRMAREASNPYFNPDTVNIMATAITDLAAHKPGPKKFHDIPS